MSVGTSSGFAGPRSDRADGPVRLSAAVRAAVPALVEAASRTGADFNALFHTARLESGFNPNARAATSSATGLFQFIDSSWLNVLARHGARHGLAPASRAEALALRTDPVAASLMAAEHMRDNAGLLEQRLGREAGPVDLYLAHFLGPAGAVRFLQAMEASPDQPAADLHPAAARANRSIFFDGARPRSLAQVHSLFRARFDAAPAVSTDRVAAENPLHKAPLNQFAAAVQHDQVRAVAAARLAYLLLADMGI